MLLFSEPNGNEVRELSLKIVSSLRLFGQLGPKVRKLLSAHRKFSTFKFDGSARESKRVHLVDKTKMRVHEVYDGFRPNGYENSHQLSFSVGPVFKSKMLSNTAPKRRNPARK